MVKIANNRLTLPKGIMDLYIENNSSAAQTISTKVELPLSMVDPILLKKFKSIPDKMAFKIGEVADILGVKQYVLRYWETEFEELCPKKSGNNQRSYSRKNVETALLIQKLLHRDRFSIEGARKIIKSSKQEMKKQNEMIQITKDVSNIRKSLKRIIEDIRSIREMF